MSNQTVPLIQTDGAGGTASSAELTGPDKENYGSVQGIDSFSDDENTSSTRLLFGTIIPSFEPIPWYRFIILTVLCAVPGVVYILAFTQIGMGLTVFTILSENYEQYVGTILTYLLGFALLLYVLDVAHWGSNFGKIAQIVSCGILLIGLLVAGVFDAGNQPYSPTCAFTILTPLWVMLVKPVFYWKEVTRTYVSWLSGPLLIDALTFVAVWITWAFMDDANEWNSITRAADAEGSACEPNFVDYPECRAANDTDKVCFIVEASQAELTFPDGCSGECIKVFNHCPNTFIIWAGPFTMSLTYFFLSFFCSFLRVKEGSMTAMGEKNVINFAKVWLFLLFAIWITASLLGSGMGITSALGVLTLASFVASVLFLSVSFSRDDQEAQKKRIWKNIKENWGDYFDLIKGLLVLMCSPAAFIYVVLSFLNQCVRRFFCFPCSKKHSNDLNEDGLPAENKDWVTRDARLWLEEFKSWNLTSVYSYAIYWGIGIMTMQVLVAQLTLLFLSWLIETTANYSLNTVSIIMVVVGLLMFLLPPVPGVPVYLSMGIVIVAIGRESLGLVWSIVYAIALSLVLKLLACSLQQKLIGQSLSNSVYVRQQVGINSRFIRATKLILAQPGLPIDKVSILVGGPDWPTSVLCGIMQLPLLPILVGTLPVLFIIVPTLMMASFTYLAPLEENDMELYPWADTAATLAAALTALVQLAALLSATKYLELTIKTRGDELDAMPIDEEVKKADDEVKAKNDAYDEASKWHKVPLCMKVALVLSVLFMVVSTYLFLLLQGLCFVEYELTSTISGDLKGNALNLVRPFGWVGIGSFTVSCFFFSIFTGWAKKESSKYMEEKVIVKLV
mmetsp:Transcript_6490/g.8781  ORF Transcript_6490/g.8781 Transcript_6490/m.8781 type:complete len:846 (+) Transcript_6490:17-2554(+)